MGVRTQMAQGERLATGGARRGGPAKLKARAPPSGLLGTKRAENVDRSRGTLEPAHR